MAPCNVLWKYNIHRERNQINERLMLLQAALLYDVSTCFYWKPTNLKEKNNESFMNSFKKFTDEPMTHTGELTFLFSEFCFLQILIASVTLKGRESQKLALLLPLLFTSELLRSYKVLGKTCKWFCLTIRHSVLLLKDLCCLASPRWKFSQLSV